MPGYTNETGLILFWVDEASSLRSFKKAIGAKTIFKYRLRFFPNEEAFMASKYHEKDQDVSSENEESGNSTFWTPNLDSPDRLSA